MLGRRPSYVWRSILVAKEVMVSGSRWVVEMVNKLIFGRMGDCPL